MRFSWFQKTLLISALFAGVVGASVLFTRMPSIPDPGVPAFRGAIEKGADGVRGIDVSEAMRLGLVGGRFESNGHAVLRVRLKNLQEEGYSINLPGGLVFQSGDNQVVNIFDTTIQVAPGVETNQDIVCAATRLTNHIRLQPYLPTSDTVSPLAVLLPYLQKNPEIPQPAIQTAILALTENPPLSVFAKFPLLVESDSVFPKNAAFEAETRYIIGAMQLLKDIGYPQDRLAFTVDPQLQVEVMVDPLSHASAMKYFEIPPEKEYAYWQNLLLHGNAGLQHYALHGIARYFPDVALQMLPKWARAAQLDKIKREAAIRSLAWTVRPETIPVLEQLNLETRGTGMESASRDALLLVRQAVNDPYRFQLPVAFRYALPQLTETRTDGL